MGLFFFIPLPANIGAEVSGKRYDIPGGEVTPEEAALAAED